MAIVSLNKSVSGKIYTYKESVTVNANTIVGDVIVLPNNIKNLKALRTMAGASTSKIQYTISDTLLIGAGTATWIDAAATSGADVLEDLTAPLTAVRIEAVTATVGDEIVTFELLAEAE